MIYGVGYCSSNVGGYSNTKDKCYLTWRNMIKRCYSSEEKYKNYREQGITVCNEWLDFCVFREWYKRNYYEIENETMELDKDILNHGNKIYCPENCIFVPTVINNVFVKNVNIRGELPIGVHKEGKRYISSCSVFGKNIKCTFHNPIDAFRQYKKDKESYIKTVADMYRDKIQVRLYNAMNTYEVKIDD